MTKATRLPIALALASCGGLLLASSAWAAPAPAAPAAPPAPAAAPSAPTSPLDRLELLDQLHADLEVAKLRASIAKANAEARDASAGPAISAPGGPPMPQFGPNGPMLNLPPIAPPGLSATKGKEKDKADAHAAPTFTLVEAWGAGPDRQAIIHSDAGDRLVHVGDQIPPGVITAISGGSVAYRDAHGQSHTID